MRRIVLALVSLALALLPAVRPGAVAADCVGPNLSVSPGAGPAGTTVTVVGEAFGDNCYDTGPPPSGEGVLGNPYAGIQLSITDRAFTRTVVATVDADDDYRFEVTFAVPAGAAPGTASIQASRPSYVQPVEFEVLSTVVPAAPAFTG